MFGIKRFTLDFAGLENIAGQRLEDRILLEMAAETLHSPDEAALLEANGGERFRQSLPVPVKPGPFRQSVYESVYSTHLLPILRMNCVE